MRPSIIMFVAALAGLALSVLLILEFYGITIGVTETVCRTGSGGINACRTVAASSYASLPRFPIIGAVPTAVFGFLLYGFIIFLIPYGMTAMPRAQHEWTGLVAILAIAGLSLDIPLSYIMLFRIRAVCTLCAATYLVNGLLAACAFVRLQSIMEEPPMTVLMCALQTCISTLRARFATFALVALIIVTGGIAIGLAADTAKTRSINKHSPSDEIRKIIKTYESLPDSAIDTAGAPVLGNPSARIAITVFTDYTCDHCAAASALMKKLLAEFRNDISITYLGFPLSGECDKIADVEKTADGSCIGAMAARCAHRQKSFAAMHERLYRDNEQGVVHSAASVRKIASSMKLDPGDFDACIRSADTRTQVMREYKMGDAAGVEGTPVIFINKRKIFPGMPSEALIRGLIAYLAKTGR